MRIALSHATALELYRSEYILARAALSLGMRRLRMPLSRRTVLTTSDQAALRETALLPCSDPLHVVDKRTENNDARLKARVIERNSSKQIKDQPPGMPLRKARQPVAGLYHQKLKIPYS